MNKDNYYLLFSRYGAKPLDVSLPFGRLIIIKNLHMAVKMKVISIYVVMKYILKYILNQEFIIIGVLDKNNQLIHYSYCSGRGFSYPFINKKEIVIGPCWTKEDCRGKGIYPAVLGNICSDPEIKYYIFCKPENSSSKKGIAKLAFYNAVSQSEKGYLG